VREGGREAGLSLRGEGGRLEVREGGPEAGLSLRGEGGRLEVREGGRDGVRSPLGEGGRDGGRSLRGEECLVKYYQINKKTFMSRIFSPSAGKKAW